MNHSRKHTGLKGKSKTAYFYMLMLISVNFFHLQPISPLTSNDICLVLFLLFLILGHFLFKPGNKILTITHSRGNWPVFLILLGVLISFFPSKSLYGQSFMTSLTTSRCMLAVLALPLLFAIKPEKTEIESAVNWFSITLMIFAVLDSLEIPVIDRSFFLDEDKPVTLIDEDSYVMLLPGFQWVGISLFFCLDRLKSNFSRKNLARSVFYFAMVFILQNRTMLFISAVLFACTMFTIKGKNKSATRFFRLFAFLIIIAMAAVTAPQWMKLFKETSEQLGDSDYNRLLAYNYFLFEACPRWYHYLTGTGLISAKTSSIMKDLMDAGIYNSDVGIVGLWNHYGILPVIAVAIVTIKPLLSKKVPYHIKLQAFFILVGGLTIACFNTPDKILWLCTYIYLTKHESPVLDRREGRKVQTCGQKHTDIAHC